MKNLTPLLFLLLLTGCRPSVAEREARDRELPLFQKARAAEQQGHLDDAIKLYNETLLANPRAFSAHLSLAILQQEHAQDYINAIYHYQRYLDLQPGADKADLAAQRKKLSEQFLTQQLIRTNADAADALHNRLMQEIDILKGQIISLQSDKTALTRTNTTLQAAVKSHESEIARLKRLNERLTVPAPAPQQTTPPRRPEIPNIQNEKTAPRPAPVPAIITPAPTPAQTPPPQPAPPRTHVVQQGETLYRIAERYYNDPAKWEQIRDANQALMTDGRLRVGQTLVIP